MEGNEKGGAGGGRREIVPEQVWTETDASKIVPRVSCLFKTASSKLRVLLNVTLCLLLTV